MWWLDVLVYVQIFCLFYLCVHTAHCTYQRHIFIYIHLYVLCAMPLSLPSISFPCPPSLSLSSSIFFAHSYIPFFLSHFHFVRLFVWLVYLVFHSFLCVFFILFCLIFWLELYLLCRFTFVFSVRFVFIHSFRVPYFHELSVHFSSFRISSNRITCI